MEAQPLVVIIMILFCVFVVLIAWYAFASLAGIMKDINEEGRRKETGLNELHDKIFKP